MRTFTNVLPHTFELYVPVSRMRPETKARIIDAFGGLTLQHAIGSWRDPGGEIVTEPVYILRWATMDYTAGNEVLNAEIDNLLAAGEQAVMFTYNGTASIREKEYA